MPDKKNDHCFREKVYRLLAELLVDQMGSTLVSLEFVDEVNQESQSLA